MTSSSYLLSYLLIYLLLLLCLDPSDASATIRFRVGSPSLEAGFGFFFGAQVSGPLSCRGFNSPQVLGRENLPPRSSRIKLRRAVAWLGADFPLP